MSYLNLAVDVSSLPNGRYRVRLSSPVGEASADVDSPLSQPEIERFLSILGRSPRVSKAEENAAARDLGARLFNFLIHGSDDTSAVYVASLERAGSAGLRLRLNVENAGDLRTLAWEYIRDPQRDYLALSRLTPVVRYTPLVTVRPPAKINYPLRVLVMISAPKDFPELDVEGEWRRLNEATADLQRRGMMILERLDSATLIALQRRLRSGEYHIFHYIGHSDYDETSKQGVVVFESEADESKAQVISGAALGRELGEETSLRLVVLNSCHSATRPDTDALAGISSSLVVRGIPAVVAMQFNITDNAAQAFAEEFYRALAEMLPIDTAISEARRAIANRVQNIEWATPVLFMRSDSGVLFTSTTDTETRPGMAAVGEPVRRNPLLYAGIAAIALVALVVLVLTIRQQPEPPPLTPTLLPTETSDPATLPDLQIGNMRISPRRPAPGQIFILSITLTNAGLADSGAFSWSWDASPTLLDALEGRVDNIPPGASKNISFPYSYGWWGEFNTLMNIDVDSEIGESEERNNRRPFVITLDRELPFDVDFSLLPNNTLVEPPFRLGGDDFFPWNLDFMVGNLAAPACLDAPLDLLETTDGDVILTPGADTSAACVDQPLTITIIRGPVGDAQIEVVPLESGTATLRLYSNPTTGDAIFTSEPIAVTAGEPILLGATDGVDRQIRRIEISVEGQPVQLTRLVLLPVIENP